MIKDQNQQQPPTITPQSSERRVGTIRPRTTAYKFVTDGALVRITTITTRHLLYVVHNTPARII
jgi:hypothetical protein